MGSGKGRMNRNRVLVTYFAAAGNIFFPAVFCRRKSRFGLSQPMVKGADECL